MITSLEDVTDAEEFQAYLDWITIEFDEDRMDSAEAQRRLFEARRFLFELRPDLHEQNGTMTNQRDYIYPSGQLPSVQSARHSPTTVLPQIDPSES
jgi:hypothetical protein